MYEHILNNERNSWVVFFFFVVVDTNHSRINLLTMVD